MITIQLRAGGGGGSASMKTSQMMIINKQLSFTPSPPLLLRPFSDNDFHSG